ncbi:MAG: hypothetical protein J7605_18420 [Variovorax sp.]|nr:hypothetical protein [Variovorax sp.]
MGYLDGLEGYEVIGWAVDYARFPAPTRVEVLLDGQSVGCMQADSFRPDLRDEGLHTGHFGFRFDLTPYSAHGRYCTLEVRFEDSGAPLRGSPWPLTLIRDGRSTSNASARKDDESPRAPTRTMGAPDLDALRREGVLLYAIRSESGLASPSVAQNLKAFRELGFATVVINNFHPPAALVERDDSLVRQTDMLIEQQSRGRDFAAWRTGLEHLARQLPEARRVVFMNDSLVGPFHRLGPVIEHFSDSKADLWGLTESFDRTYHVQSSFFACTPELLALREVSSHFERYAGTGRDEAVLQGELGLSQVALAAGARLEAMCDYHQLAEKWLEQAVRTEAALHEVLRASRKGDGDGDGNPEGTQMLQWIQTIKEAVYSGVTLNPQHFFWDTLIEEFHYPYLKRELFTSNPSKIISLRRLWEVLAPFDAALVRSMLRHEMLTQGAQCALPPRRTGVAPTARAPASAARDPVARLFS